MRVLLFMGFIFVAEAQAFINVESLRIDPKQGYRGALGLSGNFQTGNTEKNIINFNSLNRYLNEKNEFLALANYKYGETNHIKDTYLGAVHLRYSRELEEDFFGEVFVQSEFNEFRSLIQRDLLGLSARFRWLDTENFFLFTGSGFFFEQEQLKIEDRHEDLRGNFYLSVVYSKDSALRSSVIAYFQPLWNELLDHRLHLDLDFETRIYKALSATVGFDYQFDNRPVVGVKKYDSTTTIGLRANF